MSKLASIAIVAALCGSALAQKPVAELPRVYIDTTYSQPTGTTWAAHTAADLRAALTASQPGDVIVLDAGVTYSGAFTLPNKANPQNKWIYIISSQLASLPEGTRVGPADAGHMPKIVSPNVASPIGVAYSNVTTGAVTNYWRIAGVELTANSNYPAGCGQDTMGVHCMTYFVSNISGQGQLTATTPQPHHIYFDRVYAHGSPTQDFQGGLEINWDWAAVVDSYIDDIHIKGFDTNGIGCTRCTGPIKIVNNYISATTENVIFGGSGGNNNPGVPSDLEFRNNYVYKPLSWVPLTCRTGTSNLCPTQLNWAVVKNLFECKSLQRAIIDSNTFENLWAAGQLGFAFTLTVRSGQSGDQAVCSDLTISNNVLKNVVSGFNTGATDDMCGTGTPYLNCHNAGHSGPIVISNNIVTHFDPAMQGGARNALYVIQPSLDRIQGTTPISMGQMQNIVIQHNTQVGASTAPCWTGIWVGAPNGYLEPPSGHHSENLWFLDNVLCGQVGSDGGRALAFLLPSPNTPPNDLSARFSGNVMRSPYALMSGASSNNKVVSTYGFDSQYQLTSIDWSAHTSDGKQAGFDPSRLGQALPPTLTSAQIAQINADLAAIATQQLAVNADGTAVASDTVALAAAQAALGASRAVLAADQATLAGQQNSYASYLTTLCTSQDGHTYQLGRVNGYPACVLIH